MRAGIYVRISKDFTGEGLGVSRQLEDCTAHAAALGWEVVEVYSDNDISAVSGKRRPAYERMLADMDAGAIGAVVAWHADRLYRKVSDLGQLVDVCKANDVQISTVKGGNIDLTTPTGRLVAGLLAQVATYEGEAKADRWRRSWRQGREAGEFARTGTRLFGYTRDGEVVPEEREIARAAMAEILTGASLHAIARDWAARGILTTRGTPWRPNSVKQYLANPRIAGWSTLNGEIVGEGSWEPLVDREDFETLRAMLQQRSRAPRPRVALLGGLVHCGKCGSRMITGNYGTRKTIQRNYRCEPRPGIGGCGGVSVRAENCEEIVEAYAKARLLTPEVRRRIEELRAQPGDEAQEITELELRIRELEAQLDVPGTPVATIMRAIDRTRERQEQLLTHLGVAPRQPLPASEADWPEDLRRRRALVDLVVERVDIGPAKRGRNTFDPERVRITGR
jgi:DNA invertase Pin-like site-specific DNA recombinase